VYFEGVIRREEGDGGIDVWIVENLGRDLVQSSRSAPWP
jgi:hypothetical protein